VPLRPPRIPDRILDWRWTPAYAALAVVGILADPRPPWLAVGLALVAAGVTLRVWSVGHLVKTDRLTRSGPYAYLRHPLYAGTLLIGSGLVLAAAGPAAPWTAALLGALFFGYYLPYKERIESARLERRYGDAYRLYRDRVPPLLPRGRRWPPPELRHAADPPPRWSGRRFRESSERHTVVAVGVVLLALGARTWLVP
jgi:protein-S-isoprenylcysteine O-methyltransferase Ste14